MPNFHLVFADYLSRPGRTPEWRESRKANFPTEDQWRREYPVTIDDVLLADEAMVFPMWAIRQCMEDYVMPVPGFFGRPARRYVKMWDQGRKHDACVGIAMDVTTGPYQVVRYERYMNRPYKFLQEKITAMDEAYPGPTYVGDDNTALAIVENLDIPAAHFLMGSLKPRCIMALKVALEQTTVIIPGKVNDKTNQIESSLPQLVKELSGYMWDDKDLVQDSVMALANLLYVAGPPTHMRARATGVANPNARANAIRASGAGRPTSRVASLPSMASRRAGRRGGRTGRSGNSRDNGGQRADDYIR